MATASPAADLPLAERLLRPWNVFWFTPRATDTASVIRIATGLVALYWAATYTADLMNFFGPDGLVPLVDLQRARGSTFPRSLLEFCHTETSVWIFHVAALAMLALFTAGFLTPVTGLLSLAVVVSYVQRAPAVTSQAEPVLILLILYTSIAPLGARWSLDAKFWPRKKANRPGDPPSDGELRSWITTVSTRLIQVHLTIAYAAMALAKFNDGVAFVNEPGTYHAWWHGQAVWWLAARETSPLVDLTGLLGGNILLVNAWTYAIMIFEAAFAIFIWRPACRRCLLWAAVPMWLSLALITGLAPFCLLMLVGNLAFVEPAAMRRCMARFAGRGANGS